MGTAVIQTVAGSPVDDAGQHTAQTATSSSAGGPVTGAAPPVVAAPAAVAAPGVVPQIVYVAQPQHVLVAAPHGVFVGTGGASVAGGGPTAADGAFVGGYLPPEFAELGKPQQNMTAAIGGGAATGGIQPIQLGQSTANAAAVNGKKQGKHCDMPNCDMDGGQSVQQNAAATAARKKRTYKVRKGDTLKTIAKRFGVTVAALRKANPKTLAEGAQPHKGQVLTLPANAKGGSAVEQGPATLGSLSKFPKSNATKQQVTQYVQWAARQYGANPQIMLEIARRESGLRPVAVNNWDSNARAGTPSKGLMQFIEPTFKSFAPQAKKANPEAWKGLGPLNWLDWRQQALTAAWAVENGKGGHWATYGAARSAAGA